MRSRPGGLKNVMKNVKDLREREGPAGVIVALGSRDTFSSLHINRLLTIRPRCICSSILLLCVQKLLTILTQRIKLLY